MRKSLFALALIATMVLSLQAKKVLDHTSFDDWKNVRSVSISNNGQWAAYMVNPQEGNGVLTLRNTRSGKEINIARGYNPQFTADSQWGIALIKPMFADTRKAKIDKKKGFDMPQDSLAIVNLKNGTVTKIARVTDYSIGKESGSWLAYMSCDTTLISPKALKDDESGKPLVVVDLKTNNRKVVNWVSDYTMSKDGNKLGMVIEPHSSDSTAIGGLALMQLPDTTLTMLSKELNFYGKPVFNEQSSMLAFTASNDSIETGTKRAKLYLSKLSAGNNVETSEMYVLQTVNEGKAPRPLHPNITDDSKRDSINAVMRNMITRLAGDSLFVNQYSVPKFSNNGKRLIIGVAPYVAPDDTTIVDFERADLDIWRWDAPFTPPKELKNVEETRKATFPIAIDIESGREQLLSSNFLERITEGNRWDSPWALISDQTDEIIDQQWNYGAHEQLSIINVETGERRKIGQSTIDLSEISPCGKYVIWFANRNYYAYEIATGATRCISDDIEFPLWDEDQDIPMQQWPYGSMGWSADDTNFYVYDKHDIWQLDPTGKSKAINITKGEGRKTNRRFRYINTDNEKRFVEKGEEILLRVFDYTTKEHGFATTKACIASAPQIKYVDKYTFSQIRRAKDVPVYMFQKSNFSTSPEIFISNGTNFASAKKVTDANPQMKEYNWGTAELVKWYAYDGSPIEGVLYKPENLDESKKYPMLVVFYERSTEELYYHYNMEPSWSWVNYPFYVSRGYVVFVPDVHYTAGVPGESAYNCICSGVEELCKRYSWINKDKIGIDGQSWGGYQTSFPITRTNMFACAGSGAPVANMTSAFGGIRWESGESRQAQYECGQSRIGRNLWEAPELYIANSPIFYADRVNTPLLIMHNDQDGAVPWYQGIEYFMGLRRLQKPVWMLQYNGEAHNLRLRKNRKDITIRLQQFFDHYLKDEPMPEWMKYGIPATRKGQEMGTSLVTE